MTWAWFGLKLLGIGRWLKDALGALLRWAGHNPWQAAVLLLCGLLAGGYWHYSGKVEKLTATVVQRDKTISDMKAASEQNRLAQIAAVKAKEQHYKDIAHEADKEHAEQLADANDALARYIATHRVRPANSSGGFSPASSAAESGNPQGGERSGPETELVTVSPEDLQICTTNTMRLIAVHDWAINLDR